MSELSEKPITIERVVAEIEKYLSDGYCCSNQALSRDRIANWRTRRKAAAPPPHDDRRS